MRDSKGRVGRGWVRLAGVALTLGLLACTDDLTPSDRDVRGPEQTEQTVADFSVLTTGHERLSLDQLLEGQRAVVLYFTMWCPICDAHMSHLLGEVAPAHPDVRVLIIDYVSATPEQSLQAQLAGGWGNAWVAVDEQGALTRQFQGTMGTTLVIDQARRLRMNEDYKDGRRLASLLEGLAP
ncbi:MAG: redoxin domain-containing protein [Gammaproteobacteria bacterium]|nr:redoxin domain-containing protein [Gammaproteobacteria bacterium]